MTGATGPAFAARIRQVLGSHSAPLVAAYFDPSRRFTGATFTSLMPNDPTSFNASDILAASLLDVPFLPRAARALLEEQFDRFMSCLPQSLRMSTCGRPRTRT